MKKRILLEMMLGFFLCIFMTGCMSENKAIPVWTASPGMAQTPLSEAPPSRLTVTPVATPTISLDISSYIKPHVIVSYGDPVPETTAFLTKALGNIKYTEIPDTSKPGVFPVTLELDDKKYLSFLGVTDTIPPNALPYEINAWLGEKFKPEDFITDLSDASEVTCDFESEPKWEISGKREVGIILMDAYGNRSFLASSLNLRIDNDPPVITGAKNRRILTGGRFELLKGVSAKDNKDGAIPVTVSGLVDWNTEGDYRLIYSARDNSNNTSQIEVTVAVRTMASYVDEVADETLEKIVTPYMTEMEKIKAIHTWVRNNVIYVSTGDKSSVTVGAYNAMQMGKGDCYTFYAISQVLLTKAGVENIPITRMGGDTRHFWSLIKIGSEWYHYDSTPRPRIKSDFDDWCFTEAQARQYTEKRGGNYFYIYDKDLYPEVKSQ